MPVAGSDHPRAKTKALGLAEWEQDFETSTGGPFAIEEDGDDASSIVSTSTPSEIDLHDSQVGPSTSPTTHSAPSVGGCKGKSKEVLSEDPAPCKSSRGELFDHHASFLGQHVQDNTPPRGHAKEVDISPDTGQNRDIGQATGHDAATALPPSNGLPPSQSQVPPNPQPTPAALAAQFRVNSSGNPVVEQTGHMHRFATSFRAHYNSLDAHTGRAISRRLSVLDSFGLVIIFIFMIEAIWEVAHGRLWIILVALLGAALDKYKNSAKLLRRTRNLVQLAASISWNALKSALGACGVPGCAGSAIQEADLEAGDGADGLDGINEPEPGENVPMLGT